MRWSLFIALGMIVSGTVPLTRSPVAEAANIVAHYKFDNSGNLGLDSSSQGNNLTSNNTPTFLGGGKIGGAVILDGVVCCGTVGTGDFFSHPTFPTAIPVGAANYTVSTWFTAGAPSGSGEYGIYGWGLYDDGAPTRRTNSGKIVGATTPSTQAAIDWWNDALLSPTNAGLRDGGWHHFVSTWDGTTRTLYLDGSPVASDTPTAPNVAAINGSFLVGAFDNDGGGCCYSTHLGNLDDFAILDDALSAPEIATVFAQGNAGIDIATALNPIPEPSGFALAVLSLLGLAGACWRRKRS